MSITVFPTFMAEKKKAKKTTAKAAKPAKKATKKPAKTTSKKATKSKKTKKSTDSFADSGIVIVDDDIEIDQDKVNEERRAYLEEARSQEAFD